MLKCEKTNPGGDVASATKVNWYIEADADVNKMIAGRFNADEYCHQFVECRDGMHRDFWVGIPEKIVFDIDRACENLGWRAEIFLDDGGKPRRYLGRFDRHAHSNLKLVPVR